MKPSYKYIEAAEKPNGLYEAATKCLELVFDHLESRPCTFFADGVIPGASLQEHRIRVNFSTSVLIYAKILNEKVGKDMQKVSHKFKEMERSFVSQL